MAPNAKRPHRHYGEGAYVPEALLQRAEAHPEDAFRRAIRFAGQRPTYATVLTCVGVTPSSGACILGAGAGTEATDRVVGRVLALRIEAAAAISAITCALR
jgi:hypothetical protein